MPLNVISNFAAHVAQRNLAVSDAPPTTSLAKLSAGTRVVFARDDAASLAVGSRLEGGQSGLQQALINAGQAVSMLQIADGAMAKVNEVPIRTKSLAVQASPGSRSGMERSMLGTENQNLISEVDRIANDTEFAGTLLVDGAIGVATTNATDFPAADGVLAINFVCNHSTAADATISHNSAAGFSIDVVDGAATNTFTGTIPTGTNDGTNLTNGTVLALSNTTNKIVLALNNASIVNNGHTTEALGLSGMITTFFNFKEGTGTSATADEMPVSVNAVDTAALGISSIVLTAETGADLASAAFSNAVDTLLTYRATVGANQNRPEFAEAKFAMANTEAAGSQLLDQYIASETRIFDSKQIVIEDGVATMSQATT